MIIFLNCHNQSSNSQHIEISKDLMSEVGIQFTVVNFHGCELREDYLCHVCECMLCRDRISDIKRSYVIQDMFVALLCVGKGMYVMLCIVRQVCVCVMWRKPGALG